MKPYYETEHGTIYQGNALEVLKTLPDESVHCCVTSPPYWGLRDYGVEGQLGLEKTPEEYVANMVQIFAEVKRVLRNDGTLWLNMGDSYAGSWGDSGNRPERSGINQGQRERKTNYFIREGHPQGNTPATISALKCSSLKLKPKDLIGIPWRIAFALQADGWYLRSDIIWHKPNPMPESVTDRPTKAHEYLFLLSKNQKYYYDADAIREKASENKPWSKKSNVGRKAMFIRNDGNSIGLGKPADINRNKRTVWQIATQPFPQCHFATFPEKLIEPCILAGTSEKGCCVECGAPWERVVKPTEEYAKKLNKGQIYRYVKDGPVSHNIKTNTNANPSVTAQYKTIGWQPTCGCKEPATTSKHSCIHDCKISCRAIPCTVLDPFIGSNTTGIVSYKHNRKFIGIDLSETYLKDIAIPRIEKITQQLKLF